MGERVVILVNPVATRMSKPLLTDVRTAFEGADHVDMFTTKRREHALELARTAMEDGATIVAVVGGDGTVSDTAGALAGSSTALLPVAAGSTNVFARALGWPHPARRALPAIRRAVADPVRREVHLGCFTTSQGDRTFVVNAGFGIDADTVQIVESRPWIKRRLRHVGIGTVALANALRFTQPSPADITVDDQETDTFSSLMVVTGSPWTYVGSRPIDLVPGATFDGRLRWLGIRRNRADVLATVLHGAMQSDGRHLGSRGVRDGWAHRITVHADQPIAFQADGEPMGWHRDATITVGPTLTVIVPGTDD